jgi:hypothetical protein
MLDVLGFSLMNTSAAKKEALHRLVDALPEDRIPTARRLLGSLVDDPVRRALDEAPLDDEPVTDEERQELEDALAEPSVPDETVRRLLDGSLSEEETRRVLGE